MLNYPVLWGKWEIIAWITFPEGTWRCSSTLTANVTLTAHGILI